MMESSLSPLPSLGPYVGWEEVIVSNEKGRREVHYYLKRRGGASSDLAVVGIERTIRHMSYHYALANTESPPNLKLKSRREVIGWLSSIVQVIAVSQQNIMLGYRAYKPLRDFSSRGSSQPVDETMDNDDVFNATVPTFKDLDLRRSGHYNDFLWIGPSWTCRKRRRHYESFFRNGIAISVQDFVYVLAEKNKRLVAYLEDLYEDSRGNKRVLVQWFHKIDEVGLVLPPNFNDREIFLSLSRQDLSAECIDGLAMVLNPQHFEKYLNEATHSLWEPFLCHRLFDNGNITAFDITQIQGYWKQEILRYMYTAKVGYADDDFETRSTKRSRRPKCKNLNRHMNEKIQTPGLFLDVASHVEVLSQDSGIRGCWFRAVILKSNKDKVKVRYEDVKDVEDETKHLEEWVLASRVALPDELGLRLCGRTTLRPCPSSIKDKVLSGFVDVGTPVDAWWHDGWWEGIVVRSETENRVHIYFPGENRLSIFVCTDLRLSQDWVSNKWNRIEGRPDFVSSILSRLEIGQDAGPPGNTIFDKQQLGSNCHVDASSLKNVRASCSNTTSCSEPFDDNGKEVVPNLAKDNFLNSLKWSASRKRRRVRDRSQRKGSLASSSSSQEDLGLGRDSESLLVGTSSVQVDLENCKYQGDFVINSSIPPLSMIMSR
ncbi:hypothetical protein GIB67_036334 [Kingdonia uniflora]|uniref:BAH domain-containing protein n=1 Tax=Kingdonia uniflora TaxID=39325 RepID=A0A7J7L3X3_9MAGN|nr:hypothetical protein GIB67_036334 [Kingdonia uniflora]